MEISIRFNNGEEGCQAPARVSLSLEGIDMPDIWAHTSRRPEGVEPKWIRCADFARILNQSEFSIRRSLRYLAHKGLVAKEVRKTGSVIGLTGIGRAVVSSALQASESKTPPALELSCLHLLYLLAWALDR